jgi:hypothetical protein
MPVLSEYMQQTSRLIADPKLERYNPADIRYYINSARAQIAAEGQGIRVLPPSASGVVEINPVSTGFGYDPTNTTVTIAGPDQGWGRTAAAQPVVVGGSVTGYTIVDPGSGYALAPPIVTIIGGGSGASAQAVLQPINTTVVDKQEYKFADVPLWDHPGVKAIVAVRNITIIWVNFRYPTFSVSFTRFQSRYNPYVRSTFLYAPIIRTQFGQGVNGSIWFSPVPDQTYPMEWDAVGIPVDLVDDTTFEALPYPWTDAIPFYASWLCLQEGADERSERISQARLNSYRMMMRRARAFSQPSLMSNPYS